MSTIPAPRPDHSILKPSQDHASRSRSTHTRQALLQPLHASSGGGATAATDHSRGPGLRQRRRAAPPKLSRSHTDLTTVHGMHPPHTPKTPHRPKPPKGSHNKPIGGGGGARSMGHVGRTPGRVHMDSNITVYEEGYRRKVSDSGTDTNDSVFTNNGIQHHQPLSAWDALEHQLRLADDPLALGLRNNRPLSHLSCSETFQRVMKSVAMRSQRNNGAKAKRSHLSASWDPTKGSSSHPYPGGMEEAEDDDDDDFDEEDELAQSSAIVKLSAQRGWALIRRTIEDIAKERKNADASFNWSFLRQHLFHMSDMEQARRELYERYIYKPNTWADGLSNYPIHFFKKPKKVMDWRGQIITLPTNPKHVAMMMKRSKSDMAMTTKSAERVTLPPRSTTSAM